MLGTGWKERSVLLSALRVNSEISINLVTIKL